MRLEDLKKISETIGCYQQLVASEIFSPEASEQLENIFRGVKKNLKQQGPASSARSATSRPRPSTITPLA